MLGRRFRYLYAHQCAWQSYVAVLERSFDVVRSWHAEVVLRYGVILSQSLHSDGLARARHLFGTIFIMRTGRKKAKVYYLLQCLKRWYCIIVIEKGRFWGARYRQSQSINHSPVRDCVEYNHPPTASHPSRPLGRIKRAEPLIRHGAGSVVATE